MNIKYIKLCIFFKIVYIKYTELCTLFEIMYCEYCERKGVRAVAT